MVHPKMTVLPQRMSERDNAVEQVVRKNSTCPGGVGPEPWAFRNWRIDGRRNARTDVFVPVL
jgi:hypothetical protein